MMHSWFFVYRLDDQKLGCLPSGDVKLLKTIGKPQKNGGLVDLMVEIPSGNVKLLKMAIEIVNLLYLLKMVDLSGSLC